MRKIRIFVSSPADLKPERERLSDVVAELNRTIAPQIHATFELVRWETHVAPAMGRPQDVISAQVGNYDIFVGLLWKRFGTPTGAAESGTEEEFSNAHARWSSKAKGPRIMFYFKQQPYVLDSEEEVEQLRKVIRFKKALTKQALVAEFVSPDEFADKVREHLTSAIHALSGSVKEVTEATLFSAKIAAPVGRDIFASVEPLLRNFFGNKAADVVKTLRQREKTLSTASGFGLAFPHCYRPDVDRFVAGVISIPGGCDWQAPDGRLVHTLLLFVGSGNDRTQQAMRVMGTAHAKLLKMLSDPNKDPTAVSLEAMARTVEHTISEANLAITVFSLS